MKKILILIFLLICIISEMQSKEIKGKIYGQAQSGEKEVLIGATVRVKFEKKMVQAKNGEYKITIPKKNDLLIVSYPGYKSDTTQVEKISNDIYDITLQQGDGSEEVIVTETINPSLQKTDLFSTTCLTTGSLRKAACCNLSESFETNASVDVSYSDAVSGAKQIEMLGLKGVYVQMMEEKIPNLRGLASMYGLGFIPGGWMNSISISKGASSVSTGFESLTGQISVDFRKPGADEKFLTNIFFSSHGCKDLSAHFSQRVSENWATALYVAGYHNTVESDMNEDSFLDKPKQATYNIMNRWVFKNENNFGLLGFQIVGDDRQGGQKDYYHSENKDSLYGMDVATKRYEVFGKRGFIFGEGKAHSVALIASATFHEQNAFFGRRDYDAKQLTGYLNLIHDYGTADGKHAINSGFSLQFDKIEEKMKYSTFNLDTNMVNEFLIPGVFTEYTMGIFKDIKVVAGVRGDYDLSEEKFILTPRLHAKWEFWPGMHLRGSIGRGWRKPSILAENSSILASSRKIVFSNDLAPEDGWNYGLNTIMEFELFNRPATFSMEYFRTDFTNQIIVDLDSDPRSVLFYNLDGESFSNSYQADFTFSPIKRFSVTTAYRYNDVQSTYGGTLSQKPLSSPHRAFINLAYATEFNSWMFDFTANYIGGGRLPNTENNPEEYRLPSEYDGYFLLNAQITKTLKDFKIYLGCENIGDFTQKNPIIAASNPYGDHFDSSILYAPISGRKFYLKVSYELW